MIRLWRWLTQKRPQPTSAKESTEALERAVGARDHANAQWARVEDVTISLKNLRRRNHFADGFRKTL